MACESAKARISDAYRLIADSLFATSGISLVACLVTTTLCLALYIVNVTPANIVSWSPYLATYDGDDDIYVTATVLAMRELKESPPALYMLGDSSFREAVYEDEFAEAVLAAGFELPLIDLRTGGQTALESLAIVDALPYSPGSVVIFGMSIRKFNFTQDTLSHAISGDRRGFVSEAVDSYLSDIGQPVSRRTGWYGIDNFRFLLPRFIDLSKRPFAPPVVRILHQSTIKPKPSDDVLSDMGDRYVKQLNPVFEKYREQTTEGKEVFRRIADISRMKGMSILAVETPLNPQFIQAKLTNEFYKRYKDRNTEFFMSFGGLARYYNPMKQANLNPAHFRDVNHLISEEGIRRFTESVVQFLIETLNNEK